jgi:hypothetical protein
LLGAIRSKDLDIDRDRVTVWFGDRPDGRRHVVRLSETLDSLTAEAIIVTNSKREQLGLSGLDAWRRNTGAFVVGFRIDRGRFVAESRLPKEGVTARELSWHVRAVAAEADRLELVLTGKDIQ